MEPPETKTTSPPKTAARLTAFETVLVAGGLVLFLVLLYTMAAPPEARRFLNPILVAIAGVILLWPLRSYHTVKALMFSGGFLLLMWFFTRLSGILLPFVVVYLLAYLFNPLVATLEERWRVPRWASTLGVTALVLGVFVLFILLLVPNIVGELRVLATRLLGTVNEFREWIATTAMLDRLEETGLIQKEEVVRRLTNLAQEQTERLASWIPDAAQGIVRSASSVFGLISIIAIVPVILFYTLKDYPYIHKRLVELFPTWGGRRDYLVQAGNIVGSYLRGQLAISAISAFNVSVALVVFDVPFALLIGLMAGVLNMIPNLGAVITMILGVLLAVIFGDPWFVKVLVVVVVLMAQGLLESSVLTPKIMSHQVGLHPVLILLSLFVFGYFLGIFGLLIAVPATAILMTFYKAYRKDLSMDLQSYRRRPRSLRWPGRRKRPAMSADAPETPAPASTQNEGGAPVAQPPPPIEPVRPDGPDA